MTPQTAVMSELLCDLDAAPPKLQKQAAGALVDSTVAPVCEPLPVDVEYADTLRLGLIEDLNQWAWRVLGGAA